MSVAHLPAPTRYAITHPDSPAASAARAEAVIERLDTVIGKLDAVIERLEALAGRPDPTPRLDPAPKLAAAIAVERLAFRKDELAESLGISSRAIDRDRAAGLFVQPDRVIGTKTPIWSKATIERWLQEGGKKK